MSKKRNFLFLQGPVSPFFKAIAKMLKGRGHTVSGISFCLGDEIYCPRPYVRYRGKLDEFSDFISKHLKANLITDIMLFGDCRQQHKQAIEVAKTLDIKVHVFECGYFRPYWITYELDGVNMNSPMVDVSEHFVGYPSSYDQAKELEHDIGSFFQQASFDISYHLANLLNVFIYPHFRWHGNISPFVEYSGYVKRLLSSKKSDQKAARITDQLLVKKTKYYLLPLQLDRDFQIQEHSDYSGMSDVINEVIPSFAQHAPSDAMLVVKLHPLDKGLVNIPHLIETLSEKYQLQQRVVFMDGGNIEWLVKNAVGVVTVNSTVGLMAIQFKVKAKILGYAFYNKKDLCFNGTLDDFWRSDFQPDHDLCQSFYHYLMDKTQVNGGLYDTKGIKAAIKNLPAKMGI
jgi:capsular polysaccharide export protein